MDPCSRCIRMEEQIVRAFTRRFPQTEYSDMEHALGLLLNDGVGLTNEPQAAAVPEAGETT